MKYIKNMELNLMKNDIKNYIKNKIKFNSNILFINNKNEEYENVKVKIKEL